MSASLDSEADDAQRLVAAILELVRRKTSTDFSLYRPLTMRRRILNRMTAVGVESLGAYLEYLEGCDCELPHLLERLTIKVSSFYRNPRAFDVVRTEVLPLLATLRGEQPLRVWSAGCARGEEAYTLAMLLEEHACAGTVYATDLDPGTLIAAREARYHMKAASDLPADLAARYLQASPTPALIQVCENVRHRVQFERHDVTSSGPPAERTMFDLISCRNVLIYFCPDEQERVLRRLRSLLADDGFLWLGEAEWPPPALESCFSPFCAGARIFRASGNSGEPRRNPP